jgi:hypothetical protein
MCWVLGNVCHHHQRAQQTRVDIIYQHSQSWKLMPRRGWVKCFLSSSYEIMNDSWFFWQQLDNSRWHQVVLPQHKTEIKHTPSNHPNWVPPWIYGLRRLKSKMKIVYKKHVGIMVAVQFRGRGVPSRAWEGRGPLPLNWVPPSMYEN